MNGSWFMIPRAFLICHARPYSSLRTIQLVRPSLQSIRTSSFHSTGGLLSRKLKDKDYFSSSAATNSAPRVTNNQQEVKSEDPSPGSKRKSTRSPAAKNSLRRVAVEAQRSRDGKGQKKILVGAQQITSKTVTAVCAAEEYDIAHVARILEGFGHGLDPYRTDLYPQVVHVALPVQVSTPDQEETSWSTGDLFVFPSGTIVAWDIPEHVLSSLVSKALSPAAKDPLAKVEEEDLEYIEDPRKENSSIKGDTIVLGTKQQPSQLKDDEPSPGEDGTSSLEETVPVQSRNLDTVLAKIAFSSGLARSTKLAVLESLLEDYFESTRSIPAVLSRGTRMPFTRRFISQKTGQLLSIRAKLNLYSELTDSLPDLFWDSRHKLGLEGYYDQVGKALDTNIRIKILNEKMDYAQEIASVLRQQLSERHSVRLEWTIILLIAFEVVFAVQREFKEYRESWVKKHVGHEEGVHGS